MRQITMTDAETGVYDGDDERAQHELMRRLIRQAQALANETGETVEVYTADGIVADARHPEPQF